MSIHAGHAIEVRELCFTDGLCGLLELSHLPLDLWASLRALTTDRMQRAGSSRSSTTTHFVLQLPRVLVSSHAFPCLAHERSNPLSADAVDVGLDDLVVQRPVVGLLPGHVFLLLAVGIAGIPVQGGVVPVVKAMQAVEVLL